MNKWKHDENNKTVRGVKAVVPFPPFELVWKKYSNSFYDISLEIWLEYFNMGQIHIVDGDLLRKSPLQELKRIEQFLNIEPYFQAKHFYFNTTRGMFCLTNPRFGENSCMANSKGLKHPKVNETVLRMMRDIFRPHNQRFYQLSNKIFHWDNYTSIK